MICAKCKTENPEGLKFCNECGVALGSSCASCGFENAPRAKFCGECGAALRSGEAASAIELDTSAVRPADTTDTGALEGERKTVTALFADLKGSTELLETLDPEDGRAIVEPLLRIMSNAVRRYEGYLVRTTGDGIFALFGAPVAYEDHPQRALYAALQMQQELRTHVQGQAEKGRPVLEARVGVHTGEVVAYAGEASGKIEYRLIGHTANLASRIEALAPAGSIAVSDYTAKLCEGYFELRSLGATVVKGVSQPVAAYEVLGPGALRTHFELSARRGLTRFVGRERELEQMHRGLTKAVEGRGQVVAVVAEAGTGKSRLFYEFKATIPATCKVLEAYSVSHGKASAWLPVLELLRHYFGIQEGDDAAGRREKVQATATALDQSLRDTMPYLFGLLGITDGPDPHAQMDARIKRQRTLEAIKRMLLRDSLKQPLILIFEDLHWIDEQTQGLLDLMADSVASARVLLLFNYRPEYRHEWTNKSYYTQLRLDPLAGAEGSAMLSALLGDGVELNPLKRLIAERTGGNPFFIEEIVQALFDEGTLVRNGTLKVKRLLSEVRLPQTVQGVLAARIDRLAADRKELLQTLAVIGRGSSRHLLIQVAPQTQTALAPKLADLRVGEFIYEQPAVSDVEYVFKHVLTQEVAYSSLLIERRKHLHERAGRAIELIFADQLDDHLSELAHHYSHGTNLDKAIDYLGRSGHHALERSANADAIASFTKGIELLLTLPDNRRRMQRELPLQLALMQALIPAKGWVAPEIEGLFARVQELCEFLGNSPDVAFALFALRFNYFVRGLYRGAREHAEEALQLAQGANDCTSLILAHTELGHALYHTGELLVAREHQENTLALYERERDRPLIFGTDVKVSILSYAGRTLWLLGYPDQAVGCGEQAVAAACAISHPNSIAAAKFFASMVRIDRREVHAVKEGLEQVIAFSTKHGLGAFLLNSATHLGWATALHGREEEGIAQMRESMALTRTVGANIGRSQHLCLLAEAYGKADHLDEALNVVAAALDAVDEQEERFYESEIYRLKGQLLLRRDDSNAPEAQRCFGRAIEIARRQSARSWELRATTSLARLLASQGRRDEARAQLAEIYDWFTEGFDTADLKDAKALLDELSNSARSQPREPRS
jgi:class 3 adenylate cyclase/predicted ATPase